MIRHKTILMAYQVLLVLAVLLTAPGVAADDAITGNITQKYSSYKNVFGPPSILVGARLGTSDATVDVSKVRGIVPSGPSRDRACFQAVTRDGLYVAEGQVSLPKKPGIYDIRPDQGWSHGGDLAEYSVEHFAALLLLDSDCRSTRNKVIVPTIHGDRSDTLFLSINSRRAISVVAELGKPNARPTLRGECSRTGQLRSTAFDTICTINLPNGLRGEAEVTLTRRPRSGPSLTEIFIIRL